MEAASSVRRRATISGIIQMGAWSLCRKIGDLYAPRSAGCSRMYSAPDSLAARRRAAVRRTNLLAWCSSRACDGATSGIPMLGWSCVLTGGGPPSCASVDVKWRATEKVEHGGEATTAA
eukprot:6004752-Pleurochrysis_carterae.AAC.1